MRQRTVSLETLTHRTIVGTSAFAQLTSVYLQAAADDYGITLDDPRWLSSVFAPSARSRASQISKSITELEDSGFVARYSVDGRKYLQIIPWDELQNVKNPSQNGHPKPRLHVQNPGVCDARGRSYPVLPPNNAKPLGVPAGYVVGGGRVNNKDSNTNNDDCSNSKIEQLSIPSPLENPPNTVPTEKMEVEAWAKWLSRHLYKSIVRRFSSVGRRLPVTFKRLKTSKTKREDWNKSMRLLMTSDEFTPAEIKRWIDWTENDGFWALNILSPGKLRKQLQDGKLQAAESRARTRYTKTRPMSDDDNVNTAEDAMRKLGGDNWREKFKV